MRDDIFQFFALQRNIFGVCPHSGELFRLSDCKIYLKSRPKADWMDLVETETDRLAGSEERLREMENQLREKAREKGRRLAQLAIRKIDSVFGPRKLNPDDAKVLFHPVDFLVFNGLNSRPQIKEIIFLDRESTSREARRLQMSIEKVIEREKYEWLTIRIREDGKIVEEP